MAPPSSGNIKSTTGKIKKPKRVLKQDAQSVRKRQVRAQTKLQNERQRQMKKARNDRYRAKKAWQQLELQVAEWGTEEIQFAVQLFGDFQQGCRELHQAWQQQAAAQQKHHVYQVVQLCHEARRQKGCSEGDDNGGIDMNQAFWNALQQQSNKHREPSSSSSLAAPVPPMDPIAPSLAPASSDKTNHSSSHIPSFVADSSTTTTSGKTTPQFSLGGGTSSSSTTTPAFPFATVATTCDTTIHDSSTYKNNNTTPTGPAPPRFQFGDKSSTTTTSDFQFANTTGNTISNESSSSLPPRFQFGNKSSTTTTSPFQFATMTGSSTSNNSSSSLPPRFQFGNKSSTTTTSPFQFATMTGSSTSNNSSSSLPPRFQFGRSAPKEPTFQFATLSTSSAPQMDHNMLLAKNNATGVLGAATATTSQGSTSTSVDSL